MASTLLSFIWHQHPSSPSPNVLKSKNAIKDDNTIIMTPTKTKDFEHLPKSPMTPYQDAKEYLDDDDTIISHVNSGMNKENISLCSYQTATNSLQIPVITPERKVRKSILATKTPEGLKPRPSATSLRARRIFRERQQECKEEEVRSPFQNEMALTAVGALVAAAQPPMPPSFTSAKKEESEHTHISQSFEMKKKPVLPPRNWSPCKDEEIEKVEEDDHFLHVDSSFLNDDHEEDGDEEEEEDDYFHSYRMLNDSMEDNVLPLKKKNGILISSPAAPPSPSIDDNSSCASNSSIEEEEEKKKSPSSMSYAWDQYEAYKEELDCSNSEFSPQQQPKLVQSDEEHLPYDVENGSLLHSEFEQPQTLNRRLEKVPSPYDFHPIAPNYQDEEEEMNDVSDISQSSITLPESSNPHILPHNYPQQQPMMYGKEFMSAHNNSTLHSLDTISKTHSASCTFEQRDPPPPLPSLPPSYRCQNALSNPYVLDDQLLRRKGRNQTTQRSSPYEIDEQPPSLPPATYSHSHDSLNPYALDSQLLKRKKKNQATSKEALLKQVISCLQQNKQLVEEIESAHDDLFHDGDSLSSAGSSKMKELFETKKTPMDSSNVLTGYSSLENEKIKEWIERFVSDKEERRHGYEEDDDDESWLDLKKALKFVMDILIKFDVKDDDEEEEIWTRMRNRNERKWRVKGWVRPALGLTDKDECGETIRGGDTSLFSLPSDSSSTPNTSNVSMTTTITTTASPMCKRYNDEDGDDMTVTHSSNLRRTIEIVSILLQRLSSCNEVILKSVEKKKSVSPSSISSGLSSGVDIIQATEEIRRNYLQLMSISSKDLRGLQDAFKLDGDEDYDNEMDMPTLPPPPPPAVPSQFARSQCLYSVEYQYHMRQQQHAPQHHQKFHRHQQHSGQQLHYGHHYQPQYDRFFPPYPHSNRMDAHQQLMSNHSLVPDRVICSVPSYNNSNQSSARRSRHSQGGVDRRDPAPYTTALHHPNEYAGNILPQWENVGETSQDSSYSHDDSPCDAFSRQRQHYLQKQQQRGYEAKRANSYRRKQSKHLKTPDSKRGGDAKSDGGNSGSIFSPTSHDMMSSSSSNNGNPYNAELINHVAPSAHMERTTKTTTLFSPSNEAMVSFSSVDKKDGEVTSSFNYISITSPEGRVVENGVNKKKLEARDVWAMRYTNVMHEMMKGKEV